MKTILFIAHDDLGGGSGRALFEQLMLIKKTNVFKPIVVTICKNNLYEALKQEGIEVFACKYDFVSVWNTFKVFLYLKWFYYKSIFNFLALRKLKKKIDFKTISLVVSNSCVIGLGAYIHEKMDIPHIWYMREFGDDLAPLLNNLGDFIDNHCDRVIAVSKAVADRWVEKGVSPDKVCVVYDGVCKPNPPCEIRMKDGYVWICMCGRLSKFKGQRYAVQALALLPEKERAAFRLDFYGNGLEKYYLRKLVNSYGLRGLVSFKGFSNTLEQDLYKYDIGLNLTAQEGFGRTTVEYMLHGLYVVGCNSGATPEILGKGKYGAMVEYGDVNQLAKALLAYKLSNETMKENAKKFAESQFLNTVNFEKITDVYQQVID